MNNKNYQNYITWRERLASRPMIRTIVVLLLATLIFTFLYYLRADEQTRSALSYAISAKTGDNLFRPHHLLYAATIRALYLGVSPLVSCDVICVGQIYSILWAVVMVFSVFFLVQRLLGSTSGALFAALFTLVTHCFWIYSTQVEMYVPVLGGLTLLATLLILHNNATFSFRYTLIIAGLLTMCMLYHQVSVIFLIPLGYYFVSMKGRYGLKALITILLVSGTVILSLYVIIFATEVHSEKTIGNFVRWILNKLHESHPPDLVVDDVAKVGLKKLSQFSHTQVANFIILPEYLGVGRKILGGTFILLIASIISWNFVQVFRHAVHYKIRLFFLIWYITYVLFFIWWSPQVYKYLMPTVAPIVVLGSLTAQDIVFTMRVSDNGKRISLSLIGFVIILALIFNTYPYVLSLHRSKGPSYQIAAGLDAFLPENCKVYDDPRFSTNLIFYFDRKVKSNVDMIEEFYNAYTKKDIYETSALNNRNCMVMPLGFVSHEFLVSKKLNPSQQRAFVEWLFNVKAAADSSGVSYSAFNVTTDRNGRAYIYIDSLSRLHSNSVEDLLQYLDDKISEYHDGFSYEGVWLLSKLKESSLIFGR